jgi:hypothetical protein
MNYPLIKPNQILDNGLSSNVYPICPKAQITESSMSSEAIDSSIVEII